MVRGQTLGVYFEEAREWLVVATKNLINRHYYGHLKGIKEWQPEWDAWGHYSKGSKEYERESRHRKRMQ
jgi:hypothetical protein